MIIVPENKKFTFKNACPYCGGDLTAVCTGWEKDDNDLWEGTDFDIECVNEPDIDSDEWEEFENNHSQHPYEFWLPVQIKIKNGISKKYRFELKE